MNRMGLAVLMAATMVFAGKWTEGAGKTPGLPPAGSDTFPTVAVITVTNVDGFPCSVLLTGPMTIKRGTPRPGSIVVISTEITSMKLTGFSPDLGGPVTLLAGSNLVGRASFGAIVGNPPGSSATSFLDVLFQLQLPGGTNFFNTNAVQVTTTVTTVPQINTQFTNTSSVALLQVANSITNEQGNLTTLWIAPSQPARSAALGVSRSVTGTLTQGAVSLGVCDDSNSVASAVFSIKGQSLSGPMSISSDCDELGLGSGTSTLQATWNTTLRAPDWRGLHQGTFSIIQNTGTSVVTFATGNMTGNNGTGTHRAPALTNDVEGCAECGHFEGKLHGKILKGNLKGAALEATYAGQFVDTNGLPIECCPPPALPPAGAFRMTIDGVVITKGCAPQ